MFTVSHGFKHINKKMKNEYFSKKTFVTVRSDSITFNIHLSVIDDSIRLIESLLLV